MIRKRSKLTQPIPSIAISVPDSSEVSIRSSLPVDGSNPLKRVKGETLIQTNISGFSPIDRTKLDLPLLKHKISQVLKSYSNKKLEQQMDSNKPPAVNSQPSKAQVPSREIRLNEKLDRYIAKAYKKCLNAKEQSHMSALLEQIIQESQKIGDLNTRNWDMSPLPLLPREKQDNLNLVLNSQFLQINKNSNSSLLSAISKNEDRFKDSQRDSQMNLINSLIMKPQQHPNQLLNSLRTDNLGSGDGHQMQSRFQPQMNFQPYQFTPQRGLNLQEQEKYSKFQTPKSNFDLKGKVDKKGDYYYDNTGKVSIGGKFSGQSNLISLRLAFQ
jgi:hypothetical protein